MSEEKLTPEEEVEAQALALAELELEEEELSSPISRERRADIESFRGITDPNLRNAVANGLQGRRLQGQFREPSISSQPVLGETPESVAIQGGQFLAEELLLGAGTEAGTVAGQRFAERLLPPQLRIPAKMAGAAAGFFVSELSRQRLSGEELDPVGAAETSAFVSALPFVPEGVGRIVNLGGKTLSSAQRIALNTAEDVAATIQNGKVTIKKPADVLANFLDGEDTLANALGASASDFNRFYDAEGAVIRRLPEALNRVEARDIWVKSGGKPAGTFKEMADMTRVAREAKSKEVGEKLAAIKREFPNSNVDVSSIDWGIVESEILNEFTDAQIRETANRIFTKEVENIRGLALSPKERATRANALRVLETDNNFINKKLPRLDKQSEQNIALALGSKIKNDTLIPSKRFKLYEESQRIKLETDELIASRGVDPLKFHKKRVELDKGFLNPQEVANTKSASRVTKSQMANVLRGELDSFAKGLEVDSRLGTELKQTQSELSDLLTVEPATFFAEAVEKAKPTRRLLLGFGARAAAAREVGIFAQSSRFALGRHNLARKLRGSARAVAEEGREFNLPEPARALIGDTIEASREAARFVDSTGRFIADVGTIMRTREKSLGTKPVTAALMNTLTDAMVFRFFDEAGLTELEANEETLAMLQSPEIQGQVDQAEFQAKQILDGLRPLIEAGDEEALALGLSRLAKEFPEILPPRVTGIVGEVPITKGRVMLPELGDRLLYSDKLKKDTKLTEGQRAVMRNSAHKGEVLSPPKSKSTAKLKATGTPGLDR